MSDLEPDLVAGHPPAVKAGGKRVVTKHKPHEKPDADAFDQKYIDQLPEQMNIVTAPALAPALHTKGAPDIPESGPISPHIKPQPTVQKAHSPNKARKINQPRR